jgi:hypothetical protein
MSDDDYELGEDDDFDPNDYWEPSAESADEDAAISLETFFKYEGRSAEFALPVLIEELRTSGLTSLNMIADMLDLAKPGTWKLELRRNMRGKTRAQWYGEYEALAKQYFSLRHKLEAKGARSPDKAAKRELERQGIPPAAIRASLKWWSDHLLKSPHLLWEHHHTARWWNNEWAHPRGRSHHFPKSKR